MLSDHPQFVIGREYHRRTEIHDVFGGQRQGGISTPRNIPAIFIFTSNAGEQHGYHDEYREDGLFCYTGEGQIGDMRMVGGNESIRSHQKNNKSLHLFEYTRPAYVRYVGSAECLGFDETFRPDREGKNRKVFVFLLDVDSVVDSDESAEPFVVDKTRNISKLRKKSIGELRKAALQRPPVAAREGEKREFVRYRSEALKLYVIKRSEGVCEGCGAPAPFRTKTGPYLECHHLHRLADGGPDHPKNVVAVCPNCHRRAHYAEDATAFNKKLIQIATEAENIDD